MPRGYVCPGHGVMVAFPAPLDPSGSGGCLVAYVPHARGTLNSIAAEFLAW